MDISRAGTQRVLLFLVFTAVSSVCSQPASAAVLRVSPHQKFTKPCQAIAKAMPGDIIEIDAAGNGTYDGDVCVWHTSNLTIRGVNGRAHIDAAGKIAMGKAIWVASGDNTVIENVELSGARCGDRNGAGIRAQAHNLTIRNCYFHHNQEGILTGDGGNIVVEDSEFAYNGFGDGYSHNIYVGWADSFTFRHNYSHHANVGHLVKSRALVNYILYNRLTDEGTGNSSYNLDLPSGGTSFVIGNIIQQSAISPNPAMLSYEEENAKPEKNPVNPAHDLYVVGNTFVNNARGGPFIQVMSTLETQPVIMNNIFSGPGAVTCAYDRSTRKCRPAAAQMAGNLSGVDPVFLDAANFDYRLQPSSMAIGGAARWYPPESFPLEPQREYAHATCTLQRNTAYDIGAHEYGASTDAVQCGKATVMNPALSIQTAGTAVQELNVILNQPAPAAGAVVLLSSSEAAVTVPTHLNIAPGQSSAFAVYTVDVPACTSAVATITAYWAGALTQTTVPCAAAAH